LNTKLEKHVLLLFCQNDDFLQVEIVFFQNFDHQQSKEQKQMQRLAKQLLIFSLTIIGLKLLCTAQTDSLLNVLAKTDNPEKKVDLLNELADIYTYRNLDSALYFVQEAISISRNSGYRMGEVNGLIKKCDILRERGKYDESLLYADRIKEYAEQNTDKNLLARYYYLSGYNFLDQQAYNLALEQFKKSFELFREIGDLIGMGDAQRKIAQSFDGRGEYNLGYDYKLSALNCYKQAGYQRGIAASLNNIANYFEFFVHDFEKAGSYLLQAENINIEAGNHFWLSKNYFNHSFVMLDMHEVDSAFYYSSMSSDLAAQVGNPYWHAISLMQLAYMNGFYGEIDLEKKLYFDALILSEQVNSFDNLKMITDSLSRLYFKCGIYDSAFLYLRANNRYSDSLGKKNNNIKFTELKYQIEIEKNKQIAVLKNLRQFYAFLLVSACLVFIIIILILLYTRQKIKTKNTLLEKENLANKVDLKNKELTSKIIFAQKKNEIIGNIVQSIEGNRNSLPIESRQLFDEVIQILGNTIDEKGWEDFELSFSHVHESFFTKLDQKYPNLTVKERRLCALLRLNMSSKQIAEITQLLPRSVDTARHRLRLKLGIENVEVDMISFLIDL